MKIRRMDEMGITVIISNAENRRFEVPSMRDWEPQRRKEKRNARKV
jgi:hypothetical protein